MVRRVHRAGQLRPAPVAEEQGRHQADVDAAVGPGGLGTHPLGRAAHREANDAQRIAAGVEQCPTSEFRLHPDVALWIGESARWVRAQSRYQTLTARWPVLAQQLPRYFDVLADYGDADFRRLAEMLGWINLNPKSNLYPRQIPIAGADSKWLDSRKGLISDLVATLQGDPTGERDFFRRCGLRAQPQLMRMRVLDPELRARLGGLGDISAPCEEVASVGIRPKNVFVVENLQTGLAFDDLPGAVVIMRLGYAVDVLGQLPWLQQAQCIYWGDIDTHGFSILNRAEHTSLA